MTTEREHIANVALTAVLIAWAAGAAFVTALTFGIAWLINRAEWLIPAAGWALLVWLVCSMTANFMIASAKNRAARL